MDYPMQPPLCGAVLKVCLECVLLYVCNGVIKSYILIYVYGCVSRRGDYFDEDAKVRNEERERDRRQKNNRQKKEERQHFNPVSYV